jgi:hypothetical protein
MRKRPKTLVMSGGAGYRGVTRDTDAIVERDIA